MPYLILRTVIVGIVAITRRLKRSNVIQRAAAIAAGADIDAVSRWRCEQCSMMSGHKPMVCIRCKGNHFAAIA